MVFVPFTAVDNHNCNVVVGSALLERHACEIYTRSVFFEVQTKIHRAPWTCSIKSVNSNEEAETYLIEHLDKRDEKIAEYKVVRNLKESTVVCSCNHIGRHGYLCRHVFKVLQNAGFESIPEEYILRRWRRDLIHIELQNSCQRICD
ncbi:Zinc finger, SWIM-type, partial [Cynara cardunculus var. scolymus]